MTELFKRDSHLLYLTRQVEAGNELASAAHFACKSASYARFGLEDKADGLDCHVWDDLEQAIKNYRDTQVCVEAERAKDLAFEMLIYYGHAKAGTLMRHSIGFDPSRQNEEDEGTPVGVEEMEHRLLGALDKALVASRRCWNILNRQDDQPDEDYETAATP